MAFVQSPLPPEQQNQFAPQGQTTPNPLSMLPPQAAQTGGSSGQGGGQGAGQTPGIGSPTQFGSSASKLGDYLKANQDQVQTMANQIAGQIGTNYGTIQQGIDQAGQTFGSSVSSGYTPSDPSLISQVQANPTSAASNPDSVKAFQSMLNDQYTGPTSFEGSAPYQDVQKQVSDAVQQANLLGTYPGLSQYLQNNIETNPTQGQNTLDTVLLQGSPTAVKTVQDAAQPFQNLPTYLAKTASAQDAAIQAAQQAAPATAQSAKAALTGAEKNLQGNLNNELTAANSGYNAYNQSLSDLMAEFNQPVTSVAQGQWAGQNVDPRIIASLSGINLFNTYDPNEALAVPSAANYLGKSTAATPPGVGDVATQGDVDTANALALLSGGSYQPTVTAPGSYKLPSLPTIDQNGLGGDLYSLVSNANPTFTGATNANAALNQYQYALSNLRAYLGLPPLNQQPPVIPPTTPPTSGGGGGTFVPPPQNGSGGLGGGLGFV